MENTFSFKEINIYAKRTAMVFLTVLVPPTMAYEYNGLPSESFLGTANKACKVCDEENGADDTLASTVLYIVNSLSILVFLREITFY